MKVGAILPTFRHGAQYALAAARACEAAQLDGVFAYDHLWPMGRPDRPSLAPFPLLAAAASITSRVTLAPLVARVGLVSNDVLVGQFEALATLAPGRVVAPLGTGDSLSRQENLGYGVPFPSGDERRALLESAAIRISRFAPVWVGAGALATNEVARTHGFELNVWGKSASDVAALATDGPVNWAGDATGDLATQLDELAAAGATWAVFSPSIDVGALGAWRETNRSAK